VGRAASGYVVFDGTTRRVSVHDNGGPCVLVLGCDPIRLNKLEISERKDILHIGQSRRGTPTTIYEPLFPHGRCCP